MRVPAVISATVITLLVSLGTSHASTISFTPGSVPTVAVSPAFGAIVPGGTVGSNYVAFGVDFSYGGTEGVFDDPPLAFAGTNASGIIDLLSPVDGRIVAPGTTTQGVTDFLYAEAGDSPAGLLTLTAFDLAGHVIQSVLNGNPLGPDGLTTFSISAPGIAAFRITSAANTFGVDVIRLNTPSAVAAAPIPGALPLFASALIGLCVLVRRSARTARPRRK
jgi:hypothetical protein